MKVKVKATGKIITVSDMGPKFSPRYWSKKQGYMPSEITPIGTRPSKLTTKSYHVSWEIDLEANFPEEAALQAWETMRKEDSIANYFTVKDSQGTITDVDLEHLRIIHCTDSVLDTILNTCNYEASGDRCVLLDAENIKQSYQDESPYTKTRHSSALSKLIKELGDYNGLVLLKG